MTSTTPRDTEQNFDLYVCKYSLCSMMTRYTIAVAGKPKPQGIPVVVKEHEIDIVDNMTNLDEEFLVGVNPKGQVPVWVSKKAFPESLTESLDIAKFLIERYPGLAGPEGYIAEADELLNDLHQLDYYSLSFSHTPALSNSTITGIQKRLTNPVSKRYEEALKVKLNLYISTKSKTFEDTEAAALNITAAENEARNLIAKTELVMARNNGPWIYGSYGPTALDAHFILFLRRMKDVGHYIFFTERISRYLTDAEKTPEFQHIMQGRDTVPASMKK